MSEADHCRRQIMLHLTSWVWNNTDVVTDPKLTDSASLEHALNEVNGVVFEIEGETFRKPLGLEAEQLLVAAELVMRRAAHYAGRGETHAETQCLRAALTMVEEAGWYFADIAEECRECEKSHLSAGIFCLQCRKPFRENMPAEAQWFIVYDDEGGPGVWVLRNGVGHDTLIFAYNTELGADDSVAAQKWAADVMKSDYALDVEGWSPEWDGEQEHLTPDYWIAVTRPADNGEGKQ